MARKSELNKTVTELVNGFGDENLLDAIGNIGIIFGPPITLMGIIAKILGGNK